jgi:hypothetical protein
MQYLVTIDEDIDEGAPDAERVKTALEAGFPFMPMSRIHVEAVENTTPKEKS